MARAEPNSLRLSRTETERLVAALVISACLHLVGWGVYEAGKKYQWWQYFHLPAWLHPVAKKNPPPPPPAEVQPQIFVDVVQSEAEPPKNTPFYSNKNAHAANPDEDKNSNQPKLDGHQTVTPKTEDAQRLSRLQPSAAPQPKPQAQTPPPASHPASPQNLGDVKSNEVSENQTPSPATQPATPPRPRTLRVAREQLHLPGQQMRQIGDAHRRLHASLDVKATPFADYDGALIEAVTQRWYDLLDSRQFADDRTGTVTIKFKVEYDGTVRDMQIVQNSVGTLLGYICQESIEESAPFGKWPDDMRRMVGENYREWTFTFHYY